MSKKYIKTHVTRMFYRQSPELRVIHKRQDIKVECFIDTLEVHFNKLNQTFVEKCQKLYKRTPRSGYKKGLRLISIQGVEFSLYVDCLNESKWKYKIAMTIRFAMTSYGDLEVFLSSLISDFFEKESHQINRVDIGFALNCHEVPANFLIYTTHLKWNRRKSRYTGDKTDLGGGGITGFHSNGQGVRTSVYTEGAKPAWMRSDRVEEIKMEFQIRKKNLIAKGIYRLSDLAKIEDTNLLDRIKIYNTFLLRSEHKRHLEKFVRFQEDVLALGFTQARKNLDKNGNFKRDFEVILMPLKFRNGKRTMHLFLRARWASWLRKWCNH
ncbi:hypothetical protein [Bdellovibrio bacteriovorus]|uniref:Uncharacterized protein n=1 Tax=Bdellovibrio bacteriovorus str. Tiberius TaxID=1069642 RepID=K7ZEW4_BDEBC|nr:hypothetical protein [Bdellovibrio bacteriovorus]AFY00887.1 Hypothetical protein Bdt_1188 [Bdellovibrio bacteriovorus str. Tiberius]